MDDPRASWIQRKSSLVPGFAAAVFVVVFFAVALIPTSRAILLSDGDVFLHVRLGQDILASHALPATDTLSYTMGGKPYIAHEWAFEVLLAAVTRVLANDGIIWLAAFFAALTFAVLAYRLRRSGHGPIVTSTTLLLVAACYLIAYTARPHLVSELAFAGAPLLFSAAFESLEPLIALGLTALWTCFHPASLLFTAVLACKLVGDLVVGRRRPARATLVFGAAIAGLVCTPYGPKLPLNVLRFFFDPILKLTIDEHLPLPMNWSMGAPMIALFVLALAGLALTRRDFKANLGDAIGFIFLGAFALHSKRWSPIAAIAGAPFVAAALTELARRFSAAGARAAPLRWADAIWAFGTALAFGVVLAANPGRLSLHEFTEGQALVPFHAAQFVKGHPTLFGPRMYNSYEFGGYLAFALPQRKVFVDGRAEFYGVDLVVGATLMMQGEPKTLEVLDAYKIDWAIFQARKPLSILLSSAGWTRVYVDPVAVIYVRPARPRPKG